MTKLEILDYCKVLISKKINIPKDQILNSAKFSDLRLSSIHAMQMILEFEEWLNIPVSPIIFWENPTLDLLCTKLFEDVISSRS